MSSSGNRVLNPLGPYFALAEQAKHGPGPWVDDDGCLALGWIVGWLQESLWPIRSRQARAQALWQVFDDAFHARHDYVIWRRLGSPSFSRRGRAPGLEPHSTTRFGVSPSETASPNLEAILPSVEAYRALPRTVQLGIIGVIIDWVFQELNDPKSRQAGGEAGSSENAPPQGSEVELGKSAQQLLEAYLKSTLSQGFPNPVEAALFLMCVGHMGTFAVEEFRETLLPSILDATLVINPRFDYEAKYTALPSLRDSVVTNADLAGHRFLPTPREDQRIMLCDAIGRIGRTMQNLLLVCTDIADDEFLAIARFRTALLTARAILRRGIRRSAERRAAKYGRKISPQNAQYMLAKETAAFFDAAAAAGESDRDFLAAVLWRTYLWFPDAWNDWHEPPSHIFRLVEDAGFRVNSNNRPPKPAAQAAE